MPAMAAQVFGPTTVDPGFTSTGEKTLLTMSTTLPAGGRNVIIVSFVKEGNLNIAALGTYRIYKGSTLLYETLGTQYFSYFGTRAMHVLLVAVDNSPVGNDTYHFRINITSAGASTAAIHVQGIVIKADDAVWRYNASTVTISAGATATVTSISTSFPANSKAAAIAVVFAYHSTTGDYILNAGNIKLKLGGTVISSNEFGTGAYSNQVHLCVSLGWLGPVPASSQTWSVEITNNTSVSFIAYAIIAAFTVVDGAFLDTGSVPLTSGSQVTVGSLSTTLTGDVAVIALAAAENTTSMTVTAFNAGDVVLQRNHSTTGQISNLTSWRIWQTTYDGRSGVLPLFSLDRGVSNPSYQVKMTARASGINGEAKILAFTLNVIISVSDSGTGTESIIIRLSQLDSGSGVDRVNATREARDSGTGVDTVNKRSETRDSGAGSEVLSLSTMITVADSGSGAEVINMTKGALDAGSGSELLTLSASIPVGDSGAGVETVNMTKEALDAGVGEDYFTGGLSKYVDDSGAGVEYVDMSKEALDSGAAVEAVDMMKEALDAGAGLETVDMAKETVDSGVGVDAVNMAHEALDSGAGAEAVSMSKEALDSGSAVELVNMAHEALDSGSGVDMIVSPRYNPLADSGSGVETATIRVPQSDAGAGAEAVNMSKEALDAGAGAEAVNMTREARDSGAGFDAVNMAREVRDSGAGVDAVNMAREARDAGAGFDASTVTGIISAFDSGSGIDIVTQMAKAIVDSGAGVEAVYVSARVMAYDSGAGTDIIGIVARVSVEDFGAGAEFADWFLSIYGMVLIDNDGVGIHSIPYKDWRQRNIPVQVHRRSVGDKVYIDSDEIGDAVVEWEDKVSDVIPGERTLIVTGVVYLYD
jgi:hypothetical protein